MIRICRCCRYYHPHHQGVLPPTLVVAARQLGTVTPGLGMVQGMCLQHPGISVLAPHSGAVHGAVHGAGRSEAGRGGVVQGACLQHTVTIVFAPHSGSVHGAGRGVALCRPLLEHLPWKAPLRRAPFREQRPPWARRRPTQVCCCCGTRFVAPLLLRLSRGRDVT